MSDLILNKNQMGINNFHLNYLKKMKVLLIEGTHSDENLIYKNHPNKPIRGIDSLIDSFNRLNLNYKLVESTSKSLTRLIIKDTDFVFPYAHGRFGEDGRLQGVMDYAGIPYIGSGVLGSAICSDKLTFKRIISHDNIPTPPFFAMSKTKDYCHIMSKALEIGYPVMVKLRDGGSSLGIYKFNEETDLLNWLKTNKNISDYFVEKWVSGRFITVGMIATDKGVKHLPLLEVITSSEFYDEKDKLAVNANITPEFVLNPKMHESLLQKLLNYSYEAFEVCNCESVARLDFIITDDTPELLEVNTIAGMAVNSNLTLMFKELGYTYDEMIIEIFKSGYNKSHE